MFVHRVLPDARGMHDNPVIVVSRCELLGKINPCFADHDHCMQCNNSRTFYVVRLPYIWLAILVVTTFYIYRLGSKAYYSKRRDCLHL